VPAAGTTTLTVDEGLYCTITNSQA
jgi:hypothetical protein